MIVIAQLIIVESTMLTKRANLEDWLRFKQYGSY